MNTRPRLRTRRIYALLTEREHAEMLRMSAKQRLRQGELIRLALQEYARRVA